MMARRNLITDVPGLSVGNAHDPRLLSGVTVLMTDEPAVASAFLPGGAPAARDTALLAPEMTVERVDAITLSGGSVFGLDAPSGVAAWLRERGRGLAVGPALVPIVPGSACFDLTNGGDKDWGRYPPYRDLAYLACEAAAPDFALGTQGGGCGATTVDLRGGLGSASAEVASGAVVGALVVVNAVGTAVVGGGPYFWAAPWERAGEFGALGPKPTVEADDLSPSWKGGTARRGTTIAIVATDAALTAAEAKRLAIMASAGLARALRPAFAPMDGDTVYAVATGRVRSAGSNDLTDLGGAAADCLARATARGVYEAGSSSVPGQPLSWREKFAKSGE